jgi:hypothetical protein
MGHVGWKGPFWRRLRLSRLCCRRMGNGRSIFAFCPFWGLTILDEQHNVLAAKRTDRGVCSGDFRWLHSRNEGMFRVFPLKPEVDESGGKGNLVRMAMHRRGLAHGVEDVCPADQVG